MLADVIYYCKMMSVMAIDGVTSFLRLKDITNTCKHMGHIPTISGNSSVQWRKVGKKLNTSNVFLLFIVC